MIVAHSLGGLLSRYAIGLIYQSIHSIEGGEADPDIIEGRSKLRRVQYHSFLTMCTPHLGVRKPGGNLVKDFWRVGVHAVAPSLLAAKRTGADLLLLNEHNTLSRDAILWQMASPD